MHAGYPIVRSSTCMHVVLYCYLSVLHGLVRPSLSLLLSLYSCTSLYFTFALSYISLALFYLAPQQSLLLFNPRLLAPCELEFPPSHPTDFFFVARRLRARWPSAPRLSASLALLGRCLHRSPAGSRCTDRSRLSARRALASPPHRSHTRFACLVWQVAGSVACRFEACSR